MEKKLTRDTRDKMIAGVAAGIAKYFQLDVTWVRVAFALAAFFGGSGLWIYIILWIAIPQEFSSPFTYTDYTAPKEPDFNYTAPKEPTFKSAKLERNNTLVSLTVGSCLVLLGGYLLLREFDLIPYWFSLYKLWPLIFVIFGLVILFRAVENNEPKTYFTDEDKTSKDEPEPRDPIDPLENQSDNQNP